MSSYRPTLEDIVALCKRRGFVFQSAEIYGGLNGIYDFGPLGTLIKNNLRDMWKKSITSLVTRHRCTLENIHERKNYH